MPLNVEVKLILCVPDHVHPSLEAAQQLHITDPVIGQCERLGDRFAILSVPGSVHWSALQFPRDTAFAATYFPRVPVSSGTGEPILIPAMAHIEGAYAQSDLERGIQNRRRDERYTVCYRIRKMALVHLNLKLPLKQLTD
jgi:hypothetical protein